MFDVEKISNTLAARISATLNFDKDFEEVLAYGAFSILQTLHTILFILLFGMLFQVPLEAFVISFAASILRKYSGGVHASTSKRCAIIGTMTFVSIAILVEHFISTSFIGSVVYSIGCFGIAYFIMSKNAPQDTPNKPLTDPEVRKNLRRKSIGVLHIFLVIVIAFLLLYFKGIFSYGLQIILCISSGILWQSITLTYIGKLIISYIDQLLGSLFCKIGGERS